MSNLGSKVKGAFNTIHGVGENIRGTTLGAVDTMAHDKDGEAKNEAIGQKGRSEIQRGMEGISGRPQAATTTDYPKHHRDDEVYNDSQAQGMYQGNDASQPAYNAGGQASGNTGYGTGNVDSQYAGDMQSSGNTGYPAGNVNSRYDNNSAAGMQSSGNAGYGDVNNSQYAGNNARTGTGY
ncbi:hypothetical protein BT96DRAFT_1012785 [Gymnopus androsaceus JB14]|uniref:Uncharacterized protein n=1 Tax=Gymnopus androsaceus JB14 TaxID=1447944 RepID=A0A6A4IGS1_9AGAR|nr:hypothetical protein BT96DRAFT_1012785 [Gymnopus androsaceus JB14]